MMPKMKPPELGCKTFQPVYHLIDGRHASIKRTRFGDNFNLVVLGEDTSKSTVFSFIYLTD